MRVLLCTFGSYGDLHPYLAVGVELRHRGHEVTIATSALYQPKVTAAGIAFHAVRPDVSFDDRDLLAYVMDARRGSERIVSYVASVVRESYEDTVTAAERADIVVTHPITFAAVLAAHRLGKPWVSTVLAPLSFFSAHEPPVLAPAPWVHRLSFLGPKFSGAWIALGKRHSLDWVRPLLKFRAELALPPAEHPLFEGQHAPLLVLAMYSRYMAARQPDWPPQAIVTGFPFWDEGELPAAVEQFFEAGPAPVVFTLGSSAVGAAGDFYLHSLQAVERLGARAVFLTGSHTQGLPRTLPDTILTVGYAAHAAVFARAAAIVHQGGVGTTGQAMRAGRPMLVVPFAHDQFDNAERVRRLGAAEVLRQSRYTAGGAEERLRRLLTVPSYAQAAASVGDCVGAERGAAAAADAIERLISSSEPAG